MKKQHATVVNLPPTGTKPGEPPPHLSAASQELWRRLKRDFHVDDAAAEALLQSALESRDRAQAMRTIIDSEGLTVIDRFGQRRPHPLLIAERDAKSSMLSALRALRLAPETVGDD